MGLARFARREWPLTLIAGVVLACAAMDIHALADRSRGEPRNRDIRRYVLGEIYDEYRVEQRFFVKANGLSSVTVYPRPASPAPSGTVILQLRDVTDSRDPIVVKRVSVPTASLVRSDSFTLHVPPQPSLHREYGLDVTVEGGSDGQGIGLLAARGGSVHGYDYQGANLFINGRRQYGNLVFETTVDNATTNFGSIASQMGRGGIPAPLVVLVLILLAKYAALFLVIHAFVRPADAAAPAVQTPQSLPA